MPEKKLKSYLDENNIRYITIIHSQAYTAQEVAESAHIPGKEIAKTVMIKIDGKVAMAVLPATEHVNLDSLKNVSGSHLVELASEQEFIRMFPGCEAGAMPPFGNLYNMDVYVDEDLLEDEEIAFNAGSHTELMKLTLEDYKKLVNPKICKFSVKVTHFDTLYW